MKPNKAVVLYNYGRIESALSVAYNALNEARMAVDLTSEDYNKLQQLEKEVRTLMVSYIRKSSDIKSAIRK